MADYTEAQIVALKAAIASGVTTVKHGDKTVIYRSIAEMRAILADMLGEVRPTTKRPRTSFGAHNRG